MGKRENGFIKHDEGKPDYTLVEPCIIEAIAAVGGVGEKIYGRDNWKLSFALGGERAAPYRRALYRHWLSYVSGRGNIDPDSGMPHLWHVAWNAMVLIYGEIVDAEDEKNAASLIEPLLSREEVSIALSASARFAESTRGPDMWYVASPYSVNPDRSLAINKLFTDRAISDGDVVYNPVVYACSAKREASWEYWIAHCKKMLTACNKLVFLYHPDLGPLSGSRGATEEVDLAKAMGIPCHVYDFRTEELVPMGESGDWK